MLQIFDTVRRIGIETVLPVRRFFYKKSNGKLSKTFFSEAAFHTDIRSDVRIIKKQEDAVFLAKCNPDGSISDRDFVILSTTDLHLEGHKPEKDAQSIQMLTRQIAEVKPDLVIFTGDVIQTAHQHMDAAQFADMMEKIGVYWVYVYGNHEAREVKSNYKKFLYDNLMSRPHCLCLFGKEDLFGYGNFAVHIMNSNDSLSQSLYFFDSGRDIEESGRRDEGLSDDVTGYDFLKKNQIQWYKNHVRSIEKAYGKTKSMQYFHIPLPEYEEVFTQAENKTFVPSGKAEIKYGSQHEGIGCAPYNSGMFAAIKELGSTQAVFCGHDHVNDFCALYDGVYLVYNQPGGYATYNLDGYNGIPCAEKDLQFGVTVTTVRKDGGIDIQQRLNNIYL